MAKPKGGRPARNFDPRYGAKKGPSFHERRFGRTERPEESDAAERRSARPSTSKPGSKSPKHRGYRAEEAAPKRRWSAEEKAGRDESRAIRGRAESGRRESPHHRVERPVDDRRAERGDRMYGDQPRTRHERVQGAARPRFSDSGRAERGRTERDSRFTDRDRTTQRRGEAGQTDRNGRTAWGERDDRRFADRSDRGRNDRSGAGRPYADRGSEGRGGGDRGDRRYAERSDRPAAYRTEGRSDRGFADRRYSERSDRSAGYRAEGRSDRGFADRRDDRRTEGRSGRGFTDRPGRDDRTSRGRAEARPSRADWRPAPAPEQLDDVVHERLKAQAVAASDVSDTTFGDLGLGSNIVETLANQGAEKPFPIQAATIPSVLEGRDVLGRGRTGSGKTIAFGAPLVERVLLSQKGKRREFGRAPRALILAPTRELALQIDRTVQPIARSVGLFTTQIYGGVPQARQVGALRKGVDIIIGTPGRIEDLERQGKLDLSDIQIAVLDEADHMAELGFVEPVQRILRKTAEGSQKLLFSATLDREVAALVDEFLIDPAVFEVAGEDQGSSTIDHRVLVIEHRDKADILSSLVDREGKTLVFSRTRAYAEMLAEQFDDLGIPTVALHGDLNQAKRTRNLQKLTSGRVNVLVATDVAARGIHVDDIDLVIQADAPDEYKTYLHRAGRTGRAGRSGTVITLIARPRRRRMQELLERAEIRAPFEEARPGDDLLEELSGRQLAHPER